MSIQCIIRSLKEPRTGKEILFPDVLNAPTIDEEAFIDFVCRNRKLERAQVRGVLDGISISLGELLKLGHLVKVDGIGSFSVDVKGELVPDKRGVLQLKDPKIKSVKVKPSVELIKEMGDCRFTLVSHNTLDRANTNSAKAREVAMRLLEDKAFFSTNEFRKEVGGSNVYVLKLLNAMVEDNTLKKSRFGRGYIWMKTEE